MMSVSPGLLPGAGGAVGALTNRHWRGIRISRVGSLANPTLPSGDADMSVFSTQSQIVFLWARDESTGVGVALSVACRS